MVLAPPTHNLDALVVATTASVGVTVCVTTNLGELSQAPIKEETYHVVVDEIDVEKLFAGPDCNTVVEVGVAYHL